MVTCEVEKIRINTNFIFDESIYTKIGENEFEILALKANSLSIEPFPMGTKVWISVADNLATKKAAPHRAFEGYLELTRSEKFGPLPQDIRLKLLGHALKEKSKCQS